MEINTDVLAELIANYNMWILILVLLYAFSLYVYFFPTPLSNFYYGEGFEGRRCQPVTR